MKIINTIKSISKRDKVAIIVVAIELILLALGTMLENKMMAVGADTDLLSTVLLIVFVIGNILSFILAGYKPAGKFLVWIFKKGGWVIVYTFFLGIGPVFVVWAFVLYVYAVILLMFPFVFAIVAVIMSIIQNSRQSSEVL